MTYRAAPKGLLTLLLLFGCGGEPSDLAWSIQFENMADRTATAVVATRVTEGGCSATNVVYSGNINLVAGGSAGTPMNELNSGVHGFHVEARSPDCGIVDTICDEYTLPLEQAEIVSVLTGANAGGDSCRPGFECDGSGSCLPIIGEDGMVAIPCDTEDAACEDGAGVCHMGECCLGCWDGDSCETGITAGRCGESGGACMICDPGDSCQGASCVVTSDQPRFSQSPVANFFRAGDGAYWANGNDAMFMQLGPVAAAGETLRGYTGALRFADIASAEVATAGIELGSGDLYTWGSNQAAALGSGSTDFMTPVPNPTQIAELDTFRQVTGGGAHFCAIRSDDKLMCWGSNSQGQLGTGDITFRSRPEQIGTRSWLEVSALFEHTCAIRADRSLWCWGNNDQGRLGDGTTVTQDQPTRVGMANDWVDVSAGVGHTCGIRATDGDRRLYCWGRTNSGVLGIGDVAGMPEVLEPRELRADLTTWQQVAAGKFHSCGLIDRGSGVEAFCWGFGGLGELGNGEVIQANAPVPVDLTPNTGWTFISAGHDQSCGVANGTAYCWGDARGGWLGIAMSGPMAIASSPTAVVFDPAM